MFKRLIRYWRIERPEKQPSPDAYQELWFALMESRPILVRYRDHMRGLRDPSGVIRPDVVADFEPLRRRLTS